MVFFEAFKTATGAILQIVFLGAVGYFLIKRRIISNEGLDTLSRLSIDITLPFLIIYQILRDFSFSRYPNWWLFPLISLSITGVGLGVGWLFARSLKSGQMRVQFVSLVGFQNSGYLPLALFSAVAPLDMRGSILIYLFLFLTGFNLAMFSVGTCLLTSTCRRSFDIKSMLNPPVAATILGLLLVLIGVNRVIPPFLMKSVKMVGDCTLPLALFVVGGNLALIKLEKIYIKELGLLIAAKLVALPLMGLLIIRVFGISPVIGLLILVQLAVPPAVTLAALVRQYKQEDMLISQGIFLGHLVSLITIPVFLSVYFTYFMVN